jgi:hypothetical protein
MMLYLPKLIIGNNLLNILKIINMLQNLKDSYFQIYPNMYYIMNLDIKIKG